MGALRDSLRWALAGTILALVLFAGYTFWGRPGVLIAALLFVVGPVVALTIVAVRSARPKGPKNPAV